MKVEALVTFHTFIDERLSYFLYCFISLASFKERDSKCRGLEIPQRNVFRSSHELDGDVETLESRLFSNNFFANLCKYQKALKYSGGYKREELGDSLHHFVFKFLQNSQNFKITKAPK